VHKLGGVVIIIGLVIVVYLLLLVVMPVMVDIIATSNATMTASSNLTNYPGATESMIATPWVLFFVPGVIGIIVIVIYLRSS